MVYFTVCVCKFMKAYSDDLREKMAVACQRAGQRQHEVATQFGGSLSFVTQLLRRQRTSGTGAATPCNGGPVPGRGRASPALDLGGPAAQPDAGPPARCAAGPRRATRVPGHGLACAGRARVAAQKKALHAAERDTPRLVALRAAFVEAVARDEDPTRFQFVDETGLPWPLPGATAGPRTGPGWVRACPCAWARPSRSSGPCPATAWRRS